MGFMDIFRISAIKQENEQLKIKIDTLQRSIDELGVTEYRQTKEKIDRLNAEFSQRESEANSEISSLNT